MKAYVLRDAAMSEQKDLAFLLYYERAKRFIIELCASADEWDLPPFLATFARKNFRTIDFHWSRIWVGERIIPEDRQNLGMILREFGLNEYDPYALLMIAQGRCAQDDCYLTPLKEDSLPSELQERLRTKIHDFISVSGERCLLIREDGHIDELHFQTLSSLDDSIERLLRYYHGLSHLQISPGGQGLEWNPEHIIPLEYLHRASVPASLCADDLIYYVQKNLVSTGEAARLLGCSRQNINDLMRRGKLKAIREEKNNNLFLRADILARRRD